MHLLSGVDTHRATIADDGRDKLAAVVISELDIWRAANLLIRQHAADAGLIAAQRAGLMLERGDRDGQLVWMQIRRAICKLQAPRQGPVH